MYIRKTVLTQVIIYMPEYEFQKCVDQYKGNYKANLSPFWKVSLERIFNVLSRLISEYLEQKYFPIYIKKHRVLVRTKNRTDRQMVLYVFNDLYHRPFNLIKKVKPVILDLGSNIGCTIIDLKYMYPNARIIGCEMDYENYILAVKNCARYNDVELMHNAVWYEDGVVCYDNTNNTDAFNIDANLTSSSKKRTIVSVRALSVNSLLKLYSLDHIDYVKMDIEGAELQVLSINNEWLQTVREIKIEYHTGEEDAAKLKETLKSWGFTVVRDTHHPSTLIAYRN
jgi:FkbM family methyltransferase